jgi:hypothetical protein
MTIHEADKKFKNRESGDAMNLAFSSNAGTLNGA